MQAEGQHIVEKGWGHEVWLVNNEFYCAKLLTFRRGKKCSYHYHKNKTETFIIQKGICEIEYGEGDVYSKSIILKKGDSFHIPVGMRHQVTAIEKTIILEISTHHEDTDSYRLHNGD